MRIRTTIVVGIMAATVASTAPMAAFATAAEPVAKIEYSWPAAAKAIPPLNAWFARDAAAVRAKVLADANADKRSAAGEDRPFHAYESQSDWKVVTATPRFLSLSLQRYDFTGGAHGNTAFDSMLWDKAARTRLAPIALFTNARSLAAAVRTDFCRRLDAERRQKRQGFSGGVAEFDKCIDPAKQTLILGSMNRQRIDRIGFLIAPYEAGPYAEGAYEVTLPVTRTVIAAVKPAYRRYFAIGTP